MKAFEDLEKKASEAENQYALALAIARRVKHLKAGAPTLSDINPQARPFEAAYTEFASGMVEFRLPDRSSARAGESGEEKSRDEVQEGGGE